MHTCKICGKEFESLIELNNHDDDLLVHLVSEESATYLLVLPDGITPGRFEAAEAFSEAMSQLFNLKPLDTFQYIPFSYDKNGGLTSIMAVGKGFSLFSR